MATGGESHGREVMKLHYTTPVATETCLLVTSIYSAPGLESEVIRTKTPETMLHVQNIMLLVVLK